LNGEPFSAVFACTAHPAMAAERGQRGAIRGFTYTPIKAVQLKDRNCILKKTGTGFFESGYAKDAIVCQRPAAYPHLPPSSAFSTFGKGGGIDADHTTLAHGLGHLPGRTADIAGGEDE
jgi:hypothetical protein